MFSLNRIQLIGYVTQPVELRQTPNGTSVADVNIATPYTFTAESGETLSGTGFHTVTAWSGMGDVAAQYLRPGSQVFISGRLQTDTWEDEQSGEKRSRTRIVAMDMILLDPKNGQLTLEPAAKPLGACLNRADIIGHVTRDPEMRTTASGQNVLTIGVATNERWKDKATGEFRDRAEFHNVVLWGDLASLCAAHVKKGFRVHATGRVQTRSWETKQGSKRTTTEIIADALALLGVKNTAITFTNTTRADRLAARQNGTVRPASHNASAEVPEPVPEPVPVPAGADLEVPPISYQSEVKVEDLPF